MNGLDSAQVEAIAGRVMEKLLSGFKDINVGTGTTQYVHGPNSLLGAMGMPDFLVNSMIMPVQGLESRLAWRASDYEESLHTIFTGQKASTGTEPTGNCVDCREPGELKTCSQLWRFGQQCMQTKTIDLLKVGRQINRGEFVDQTLVGNPFVQGGAAQEIIPPVSAGDFFKNQAALELAKLYIAFRRDYAHLIWDGNPADTAGHIDGYQEPAGFEIIFNDGYKDVAGGGQLCKSADSLVVDALDGVDIAADPQVTVYEIMEAFNDRRELSIRTGTDPVKWAFVGRWGAFRKLTEIWGCGLNISRCGAVPNIVINTGVRDNLDLMTEMRRGSFLRMDEMDVEFIRDDSIPETTTNGMHESDLYLVPLTSPKFVKTAGNITYGEFFNWNKPGAAIEVARDLGYTNFATLNGGRVLQVSLPNNGTCIKVQFFKRDRYVSEAPFLAARFTGLQYSAAYHERDYDPAGAYHYNGGATYQYMPYRYPQF